MFDVSELQTSWLSLVGWRSSYDANLPALHSAITTSDSGLYFNDLAPGLLTVENIDASAPNFDAMSAGAYAAGTTYAAGDVVSYSNILYKSLAAGNTGNTPSSSPTWWKNLLSDYIEQITRQATVKLAGSILNAKKLHSSGKAIMDDMQLFDGCGKLTSLIVKQSRFVGFEIQMKPFNSLTCTINKLGFQFMQAQTDLTIYLFHSSQKEAIKTYTLTTTKPESMQWFAPTVAWDLHFFKSSEIDAGGAFYLGYFEDDLTGQAIDREIDICNEPCRGCVSQIYNRIAWEARNRFMSVQPIAIEYNKLDGTNLPDLDGLTYFCSTNFGMNLALTVRCDFTEFLSSNRLTFAEALQMQVGVDVLNLLAFNTRTNGISEQAKSSAFVALKGDPANGVKGLETKLAEKVSGLEMDMSGIDAPCMARKGSGLKLGGI